jgi:hypothetical protein
MPSHQETDFFISYSRQEYDLMQAYIRGPLDQLGLPYWYDEHLSETIQTDKWWDEIVDQI